MTDTPTNPGQFWFLVDSRTGERASAAGYFRKESAERRIEAFRRRDEAGGRPDMHDLLPYLVVHKFCSCGHPLSYHETAGGCRVSRECTCDAFWHLWNWEDNRTECCGEPMSVANPGRVITDNRNLVTCPEFHRTMSAVQTLDARLNEIQATLNALNQPKWQVGPHSNVTIYGTVTTFVVANVEREDGGLLGSIDLGADRATAEFIANSRETIQFLLEELRTARRNALTVDHFYSMFGVGRSDRGR